MKPVEIENQLREVVSRLITEIDLATNSVGHSAGYPFT